MAVGIALSAVVAAIAHGAGASDKFQALQVGTFAPLIVIGLVLAVVAWQVARRRAADPARLMGWLVPTVVIVSLVPDVLVGATKSLPHSSWGGVAALMVMHLVVAAAGVLSFARFLPLSRPPSER
ncbi:hypothetical protein acdb102_25040 [Acidothermaceae bacterium B102]|nr:hypothetical protein acdb102_25040 [Acidothermaceae bacterium B102]